MRRGGVSLLELLLVLALMAIGGPVAILHLPSYADRGAPNDPVALPTPSDRKARC